MTPLGNFIYASAQVLEIVLNLLFLLLLVRVILSWVTLPLPQPVVHTLNALTEPLLTPLRRLQNRTLGTIAIDLSPLVAFLILIFVRSFLVRTLYQLARSLQL